MKNIRVGNMTKLIMLLWRVMITLVSEIIFYNTYIMLYEEALFFYRGNLVIAGLYLLILILFIGTYGGYKIEQRQWRELTFSYTIGLVVTNAVIYVVLSLSAKALVNPLALACATILQIVVSMIMYGLARYAQTRLCPSRRAFAIISDTPHDLSMLGKINDSTAYNIECTCYDDRPAEELLAKLAQYKALVVGNIDGSLREALGNYCYEHNISVIYIPSMHDIMFCSTTRMVAGDSLIFVTGRHGFTVEQMIIKRLTDIAISAFGLVIASPFMLITALAVKMQDGGPVLFKQQRLTRGGRVFMLYKFRSMVTDAEKVSGAVLAGKNDNRITKVGKFIRATRIDELPQLINILKGDMSLVGPRPERPELFEEICRQYPEFRFRLKVKAGLTGYAQLYGKYNTTFEDKARMDVQYIERASLLQDIQLIMYTLKIVFMRESTEGVDNAASTGKEETAVKTR